ncbi:MAG: Fic family protein [Deltaproteobacteria bacterium]|nr:Fic family protein [Deltaproteobacteria bacterium]
MKKEAPNKLLALSLAKAKTASREGVLKATDIDRDTKARLIAAKCLMPIIRGWYLLATPGTGGGSTVWFGGFWSFVRYYLEDRFGKKGYCLSAESSIDLHSGESSIANQITVLTKKNSNQIVALPHNTSLFLYKEAKKFPLQMETLRNINVMPPALALCRLSPAYFSNKPLNVEITLRLLPSVSDISRILLEGQMISAANRLVGAYFTLGENNKANQIAEDMAAMGHILATTNPFLTYEPIIGKSPGLKSPYTGRITALWEKMRDSVLKVFPDEPGYHQKPDTIFKYIHGLYSQDAYHSLSIEGYQITETLIDKIAKGDWDPDNNEDDKNHRNALAAFGYHQAFEAVTKNIRTLLAKKKNAGEIFEENLQTWYRELFSPLIQANLLKTSDLAGYRNNQVYIRNSRHVPPPASAVVDCMETLFVLLKKEKKASVRAVLGHFIFVYIHPYMDGNGRIGRFLMNLMLVSGGYPWTIIRMEHRKVYMDALEQASVHKNITPFAKFILSEMKSKNI